MKISFPLRFGAIAFIALILLAGCSAKEKAGDSSPSGAKTGSVPPQMSQEAARVSAGANAQAAGRAAAANQHPR